MMRWSIPLILLGFPIAEVWVMVLLGQKIGWWLLAWLVLSALAGLALIRQEQFAVMGRIMAAAQQGRDPMRAMLTSGRLLLAGVLLILPGVISDAIALLLLLWPRAPAIPVAPAAANDDVIEGEFTRESEDRDRLR